MSSSLETPWAVVAGEPGPSADLSVDSTPRLIPYSTRSVCSASNSPQVASTPNLASLKAGSNPGKQTARPTLWMLKRCKHHIKQFSAHNHPHPKHHHSVRSKPKQAIQRLQTQIPLTPTSCFLSGQTAPSPSPSNQQLYQNQRILSKYNLVTQNGQRINIKHLNQAKMAFP